MSRLEDGRFNEAFGPAGYRLCRGFVHWELRMPRKNVWLTGTKTEVVAEAVRLVLGGKPNTAVSTSAYFEEMAYVISHHLGELKVKVKV